MNNEMKNKSISFEEIVKINETALLNSVIRLNRESKTYLELFKEKSELTASARLNERDGKYINIVQNPDSFPNIVDEIVKIRRGNNKEYFDDMIKNGYLDPSISYLDYERILNGGIKKKGDDSIKQKVAQASKEYNEKLGEVNSCDMYNHLYNKLVIKIHGDYLNYLWRSN